MKSGITGLVTAFPLSLRQKQLADGAAKSYLNGLSSSSESSSIFYIPEGQLKGTDFQRSLDTYMSDNREITEVTVYLSINPYSAEALNVVSNIQNTVTADLQSGPLKDSTIGITGVSSQNRDLSLVSSGDLARTDYFSGRTGDHGDNWLVPSRLCVHAYLYACLRLTQ